MAAKPEFSIALVAAFMRHEKAMRLLKALAHSSRADPLTTAWRDLDEVMIRGLEEPLRTEYLKLLPRELTELYKLITEEALGD